MSARASFSSARLPNGSREPWTNSVGLRSALKCRSAVAWTTGRMERIGQQQQRFDEPGSSAASMLACRPP